MPHVTHNWVYDLALHCTNFLPFFIAPPLHITLAFLYNILVLFYTEDSYLALKGHFD